LNILNQTLPAILATLASVVSISRISSIRPERVGLSLRGRTGTFYWFTGYGVIICPETSLLRPPAIGHAGDVVVHGLVRCSVPKLAEIPVQTVFPVMFSFPTIQEKTTLQV